MVTFFRLFGKQMTLISDFPMKFPNVKLRNAPSLRKYHVNDVIARYFKQFKFTLQHLLLGILAGTGFISGRILGGFCYYMSCFVMSLRAKAYFYFTFFKSLITGFSPF